jgi:hypothetical protein
MMKTHWRSLTVTQIATGIQQEREPSGDRKKVPETWKAKVFLESNEMRLVWLRHPSKDEKEQLEKGIIESVHALLVTV